MISALYRTILKKSFKLNYFKTKSFKFYIQKRAICLQCSLLQQEDSSKQLPLPVNDNNDNDVRKLSDLRLPQPEIDLVYFCDPKNAEEIKENIKRRKTADNFEQIIQFYQQFKNAEEIAKIYPDENYIKLWANILKLPNKIHPHVKNLNKPKVISENGAKPLFTFEPHTMEQLAKYWRILRIENLGKLCGSRAYYLRNSLAVLEQALIRYTVDKLLQLGFTLVSVPDLIHPGIIEGCGMQTAGERTQVYSLAEHHGSQCLTGTSEMALAGMLINQTFMSETFPRKYAAVSRCFRAERSRTASESGIYRVHEFNKVEMFALTSGLESESEAMLNDFVHWQRSLFSDLGLHFQVLEMSPDELGAPAYHKIDIEAWMPGRKSYGEISSASNCTDYQSRRLSIKCLNAKGQSYHVHTVNGTACAVPRMLIAILEQFQNEDFSVSIPPVLHPYTNGLTIINEKKFPKIKWSSFRG